MTKKRLIHLFQFIILAIFCLINTSIRAREAQVINYNQYFDSEIFFYDLENKKHELEEYEGETILLVFWASWCGTCEDELPKLDNLQKDFRKLPFKIIAISEDYRQKDFLEGYFAQKNIKYISPFRDINNKLMHNLEIAGLPAAYLVDANGKLRIEFRGKVKWESDEIRKMILSVMGDDYELPKNSFRKKQVIENIANTKLNNNTK